MTALHTTIASDRTIKSLGLDTDAASTPLGLARAVASLTDARWKHLTAARATLASQHASPPPLAQLLSLSDQMWAVVDSARTGYRRARGEVADELRELHVSTIAFAATPPAEHRAGRLLIKRPGAAEDEAIVRADREALAATCRRLRGERGLTQDQLAERAQVSHVTINALEKGANRPHARTLAKIAAALGVPSLTLMRAG